MKTKPQFNALSNRLALGDELRRTPASQLRPLAAPGKARRTQTAVGVRPLAAPAEAY